MAHTTNPSLKPFTFKPGLQLMPAPALTSGAVTKYQLRDQGLDFFAYHKLVIDPYGTQIQPSLNEFIDKLSPSMMSIPNDVLRLKIGRDLKYPGNVHGTITANGAGYKEIQIKVSVGGGSLVDWYSVNRVIIAMSGRMFTIVAVSKGADGLQILTIRPNDAKQNLVVSAGMSQDFPTNTHFGESIVYAPIGDECEIPYAQRVVNYDEKEFKLFKTMRKFVRNSETLKSQPVGADAYFYLQDTNGRNVTQNGNDIVYYIDRLEKQEHWAFELDKQFALLYLEPNLNSDMDIFGGGGLIPQIPKEYRQEWSPSDFTLNKFREVITYYTENNPKVASQSKHLHVYLGTAIYRDITEAIGTTTNFGIQRRADPSKTFEQAKQGYVMGENWLGLVHGGYTISFHAMPQWSQTHITGRRSPKFPNSSIRTHDMLILDLDPLSEPDLVTGEQRPHTGYSKIQLFTRNDEYMQDNWDMGIVNPDGSNAQGQVTRLTKSITRLVTCTEGIALLDASSAFYVTMK